MSMTHTDAVTVPFHAQASALLTQVASRMFDHLVKDGESLRLSEEAFEAWRLIREHAHLYGTHGLVVLEIEQQGRLFEALMLAHKVFHRYEATTRLPAFCDCELAQRIHALAPSIIRSELLEGR